jgi:hypothetical protein
MICGSDWKKRLGAFRNVLIPFFCCFDGKKIKKNRKINTAISSVIIQKKEDDRYYVYKSFLLVHIPSDRNISEKNERKRCFKNFFDGFRNNNIVMRTLCEPDTAHTSPFFHGKKDREEFQISSNLFQGPTHTYTHPRTFMNNLKKRKWPVYIIRFHHHRP